MKKVVLTVVLAVALATLAGAASAQIAFYSGTMTFGSCLAGSADWANTDTSISWQVKQNMVGGPWTYQYTLDVPLSVIDHWILELAPGTTLGDLSGFNWPAGKLSVGTFDAAGPGGANPGIPTSIYGLKFADVDLLANTFAFQTQAAPAWGDFYAVDGFTEGLGNSFAYNVGFANADPVGPPAQGANQCHLLRPGTSVPPVIPEPGSMALAMMGLLPALGYGIKRRRS